MRHNRLVSVVFTVLAIVGALSLALTLRGSTEDTPGAKELERVVDEINEQLRDVPNVGLGEGSPPPDEIQWKTDFSKSSVPLDEFESGGPQKDGIPAIDKPRFLHVRDVDFLEDREPVIAVSADGVTHGYPIQVLIWHEIVNAQLGEVPVAVTFCPLCNTAIAFDRRVDGRVFDFGTTGKLRHSDLVMYDRQTESWWQQFGGE
ncbi:MAG: DUF3179 domain-containing protein, partial [Actinobacteria bacterium]|nr:DUF3179 domain-containing protein [Actinomycetota bacterium]